MCMYLVNSSYFLKDYHMQLLTIIEWGRVAYEKLLRQRFVLSAEAEGWGR